MKLPNLLRRAATYRVSSPGAVKSLRDQQPGVDVTAPTLGANVSLARTAAGDTARLYRKRNPRELRFFAEHSTITRSAINIYRDCIERAEWRVVPRDQKRPMNERVKAEIERLLRHPSKSGEPYSTIKVKASEDFLVVGHGAMEKAVRRNLTPREIFPLDAAKVGIVAGWDGTNPRLPRYAEFDDTGRVRRWFPDSMAMVLVNVPRSYDSLGLSHVESLCVAVRAMLEGDDTFLTQLTDRTPGGVLDLGEGFSKEQVDQFRHEIQQVRHYFAVMSNGKNGKFIPFGTSERDLRALDKLLYFKRQVAGIFQLPLAVLGEYVDTSRANTDALLENSDKGPGALLWRIREWENQHIVLPFGPYEEHNCMIDYPIMSRRDEKQQAEITSTQNGGNSWISTNDARRANGQEPLKMKIADEVLVKTKAGPVPLSHLEKQYFGEGADEPAGKPAEGQKGEQDDARAAADEAGRDSAN